MLTAVTPRQNEYRTDGIHLYYVLHVGETMSRVENCGTTDNRVEELPTQQLRQMEVVPHGEE